MQLTVTDEWSSLCSSIMKLAAESLGFSSKRHQNWFDDQRHDILSLLHKKNDAHDALLRNPNLASLRQRWKELRKGKGQQCYPDITAITLYAQASAIRHSLFQKHEQLL